MLVAGLLGAASALAIGVVRPHEAPKTERSLASAPAGVRHRSPVQMRKN
jgi:hypothetical protein